MKRAGKSRSRLRLRHAPLCAALFAACAAVGFAQAGQRVVVENVRLTNHPVEIVGVEVAGEAHEFAAGRPGAFLASFDAREDWLQHFALKIKNKSDKALLLVKLDGTLAAGEEGEVPMGIEALYGRETDESAFTGRLPRGVAHRLAPGETALVRWTADEYEQTAKFLATKRPVAAYRRMRIDLREAYFEDGTVWTMDGFFRVDPNDPRKWTPLDGRAPAGLAAPPALKPGERIVEDHSARAAPGLDREALAVTEIKVNGQNITPGQPFAAGADWLRGLTVRVRNVSQKPISHIRLGFGLPEARYHAGGVGFNFSFGETRPRGVPETPGAKTLAPCEELDLSFTADDYETQMRFAERYSGRAEFSRVRMGTASIVFADGTRALVATPLRAQKPATNCGEK
ncbi:MAG TPA: hypothetical protein VK421_03965 [Pyrinomonadaceae bacterium]|nr:hypothetical protein [Pyrinomonadaceae bacterium]